MKKRLFLLLAVIFIVSFVMGCAGERKGAGAVSEPEVSSKTADTATPIDKDKLDLNMAILESLLDSNFGSDYTLVYDEGGIIISYWKENAALTATRAKSGDSQAAETWGALADALKDMTAKINEILEESDLRGIKVAVQFFDENDKDHALLIAVDGKITYDASK